VVLPLAVLRPDFGAGALVEFAAKLVRVLNENDALWFLVVIAVVHIP